MSVEKLFDTEATCAHDTEDEDMEEDDKGEFPEIKDAITKRKCGLHTGAGWKRKLQQTSGLAKRRRGNRPAPPRAHTHLHLLRFMRRWLWAFEAL